MIDSLLPFRLAQTCSRSVVSTETNEVSEAEKSQIIFLNVIDAIALDSEQSLFRRLRLLTTKGAARVEKSQKNEPRARDFSVRSAQSK
ncbi:MAG TPA: hypothetical protein IAC90_00030 [Candidatus Coproplasma stercorigallinarum]|nr:hypothetical protein [Candidatus Coproplasma stercorigallinarum]